MPMDYFCEECRLIFSVGMYASRGSYPARTLLVCTSCGTVHEVQTSLRIASQPRLQALPGPMTAEGRPDRPVFLDKRLRWRQLVLPPGLSVQGLECSCCGVAGTLADSWESDNKTCPRCHADSLIQTCGWIT